MIRDVPSAKNELKRKKRIQNAVANKNQGWFKGAKVGGSKIKNITPRGDTFIDVIDGSGLRLNNPVI